MSDLPFEIGLKRAIPDARGNWTPLPAFEGWRPSEPSLFSGHVRALVWAAIAAGVVAVGLGL